jgi:hypothetical protein
MIGRASPQAHVRAACDARKVAFNGMGHAVDTSLGYALQRRGSEHATRKPAPDITLGPDVLGDEWNRQCGGDSMIAVASLHARNRTGD